MDFYELSVLIKGDTKPLEKSQEQAKATSKKKGAEAGASFATGIKVALAAAVPKAFESLDKEEAQAVKKSEVAGKKAGAGFASGFGSGLKSSGDKMKSFGNSMSLAVTAPLILAGKSMFDAAVNMEQLEAALKGMMGSSKLAKAELLALKKSAEGPGLDFEQAVSGSVQLQAVGFSAKRAREMLEVLGNEFAKFPSKADDAFGRTLINLRQVAGMGKLTGDEIREMATLLPSWNDNLKKIFGTIDTQELAKRGIGAREIFGKMFTEMAKGSKAATDTMSEELRRMKNDFFLLKVEGGRVLFPFVKAVMKDAVPAIKSITKWLQGLTQEEKEGLLTWAKWAIVMGPSISLFGRVASAIGGIATAWRTVATAAQLASGVQVAAGTSMLTKFGTVVGSGLAAGGASLVGGTALAGGIAAAFPYLFKANDEARGGRSGNLKAFDIGGRPASATAADTAGLETKLSGGKLKDGKLFRFLPNGQVEIYVKGNAPTPLGMFDAFSKGQAIPSGDKSLARMSRFDFETKYSGQLQGATPRSKFILSAAELKQKALVDKENREAAGAWEFMGGGKTSKSRKGAAVKSDQSWRELKKLAETMGFTVTGANEKTGHNKNSPHYEGRAIDVRTRGQSESAIASFVANMKKAGARVLDERTRPPGQKVWSGPHLHVDVPKGWGQENKSTLENFQDDLKQALAITESLRKMKLSMTEKLQSPKGEVGNLNQMMRAGELKDFSKQQIHDLYSTAKGVDSKLADQENTKQFAEGWLKMFQQAKEGVAKLRDEYKEARIENVRWLKDTVTELGQVSTYEKSNLEIVKEQLRERGKGLTMFERARILAAAVARDQREAQERNSRYNKGAVDWWKSMFSAAQRDSQEKALKGFIEVRDAFAALRNEFASQGFSRMTQGIWIDLAGSLGRGSNEADRLRNGLEKIRPVLDQLGQATQGLENVMTGFIGDVFGGKGLGGALADLPRRFAATFAQIASDAVMGQFKTSMSNLLGGWLGTALGGKKSAGVGGGGGMLGSLLNAGMLVGSMVKGKRAAGGPVNAGMLYQVNEAGPELFVPGQSGTILNQRQMAMSMGGGVNLTINVSVPDASSAASRNQAAQAVASEVQRALRHR